jgi:hypothetical protein
MDAEDRKFGLPHSLFTFLGSNISSWGVPSCLRGYGEHFQFFPPLPYVSNTKRA